MKAVAVEQLAVEQLIAKYDVAGPRYTSYPTVPYWQSTPDSAQWLARIGAALREQGGQGGQPGVVGRGSARHAAAIYVHVPFCGSLCTFCGCNTRITRSHAFVRPYIDTVLAEFDLYLQGLRLDRLPFSELHLGGGTPTFLTAQELGTLVEGLFARAQALPGAALSVEVDPRVTTAAQLAVLAARGFRRISLGVQDFDPQVQDIVNRVQSEEQVRAVTQAARALGYDSINFDLIYGLPLQTPASIEATMAAVCRLRPDRIALYGYAHVPWIRPGQRRFSEADLPQGAARRALYEHARRCLARVGYREIGLDHFALESDSLWQALRTGTLHRNFMGYTPAFSRPLIGLGVSAIGDTGDALMQNEKDLQQYQSRVAAGGLPIQRGHLLDAEDLVLRQHIQRLMTGLATRWDTAADYTAYLAEVPGRLAEFAADGLLELSEGGCRVTERGRGFLRNICMAFDARLARRAPGKALFSRVL